MRQKLKNSRKGFLICIFLLLLLLLIGCGANSQNPSDVVIGENAGSQVQKVAAEGIPIGFQDKRYYGELCIPAIDYQARLYGTDVNGDGKSAQEITDSEDSASIFPYGYHTVIADHDYQGFNRLKEIAIDDTCTILFPDGSSQTLQCVASARGINAAEMYIRTYSIQGTNVAEGSTEVLVDLLQIPQSYTVMYTCDGGPDIYITFWEAS